MKTSKPFHSFQPQTYVKNRYSPLYLTFVEPDVDQLFHLSGLSFNDFFSSIGIQNNPPNRTSTQSVLQEHQEEFLSSIKNDTFLFSQSFTFPEFEEKEVTDPNLSPIPEFFPKRYHYPSPESMRPHWYSLFVEKLCQSMEYGDFDFCDLPACIVYVTLNGSKANKTPDEVRKSLTFEKWMKEFILEIPIVKVVVYDGLVTSKISDDSLRKGLFFDVFSLKIRTRRAGAKGEVDKVTLNNLFKFDPDLRKNEKLYEFLTQADIDSCKDLLKKIYEIVKKYFERSLKTHEAEVENMNTISSKFKGLFSKNNCQRITDYLGIPWKMIIHLKIASINMLIGNYKQAKKAYDEFVSLTAGKNLAELRLFGVLMSTIAGINLNNRKQLLKEGIGDIMSHISDCRSIRFLMLIPVLGIEFHTAYGEFRDACTLCNLAIRKITKLWSGNQEIKNIVLALFYERYGGLAQDQRHSLLYLNLAAYYYKLSEQTPHALRCYIWLVKSLPKKQWNILYQYIWLSKSKLLSELNQNQRALNDCKELLSLPDLDQSLQENVISQLWVPYNNLNLAKDKKQFSINSLLEMKDLYIVDQSCPEYFGYSYEEFSSLIDEYEQYVRQTQGFSRNVSFDVWYEDNNERKNVIKKVEVGNVVYIIVPVYNRYKFIIHLSQSILHADFNGETNNQNTCEISTIERVNIVNNKRNQELKFRFKPLYPGEYEISKIENNYWDQINTEINFNQLKFTAVENSYLVNMEILNFPDDCILNQCYKFSISIHNSSKTNLKNLAIICDHPKSITLLKNEENIIYETSKNIGITKIKRDILPNNDLIISYILLVNTTSLNNEPIKYHFFTMIQETKCSYCIKKITAKSIMNTSISTIFKTNETCNMFLRSKIRISSICNENVQIKGFINKNNCFLKTIQNEQTEIGTKNDNLTIVGYSNIETKAQSEEWRKNLMGSSYAALLFKLPNQEYDGQINLDIKTILSKYSLKLTIPNEVNSKFGTKINAKIELMNPKCEDFKLYIEPKDFELINSKEPIHSCRFIGKTHVMLASENNFTANMQFVAYRSGIYTLPGFLVCENQEFSNPKFISISQNVCINPSK